MFVTVISATEHPLEIISRAAGTCYGHVNTSDRRVTRCYEHGHLSVFEHAVVTLDINGLSRACANQLVRHRMASYAQESQRYVKLEADDDSWYVIPPKILYSENLETFVSAMRTSLSCYDKLIDAGVSAEDARYVLPNATKTRLIMTMNCRELYHLFDLRLDASAQWEIRELAGSIKWMLGDYSSEWSKLMDLHVPPVSAII